MPRWFRALLVILPLGAACVMVPGCGGSSKPAKTREQPADMDMDKVPPVKP